VRLAFAMSINIAQGHRYKCVDSIWKIHASHMDNCIWLAHALERKTKNIVYSKALQ
jgi:hypothetical protein